MTRHSPRAVSGRITSAGRPPDAETREIAPPRTEAKRISPSRLQEPVSPIPELTSQRATAAPPERSRRFNFPSAKNAMERPSGDQKTDEARSVPARGRASRAESARNQSRCPPDGSDAMYTGCEPSGETASSGASTPETKAPPGGGAMEKRNGRGAGPRGPAVRRSRVMTGPARMAARAQGSHPNRARRERLAAVVLETEGASRSARDWGQRS